MGLDQMMFAVTKTDNNTDFAYDADAQFKQFGTWRKHPYLQGWMEKLFNAKADYQGYAGRTDSSTEIQAFMTDVDKGAVTPEMMEQASESLEQVAKKIKQEQFAAEAINVTKRRIFNQQCVRLNIGDLDQLEMAIKLGDLPETQGFFFGDDGSEYYKEYDLKIIEAARQAIKLGLDVYYDSWW
jgi:hypothetical protein